MSTSSRRSVYLADEQWAALREVAAKLDRPVNWVVRQAVTVFLDTYRPVGPTDFPAKVLVDDKELRNMLGDER